MSQSKLDESTVLSGFVMGAVVAAVIALFRLPDAVIRRRRQLSDPQERRKILQRPDAVNSSIEAGRALAAERRAVR